jgi:hypothetical protein
MRKSLGLRPLPPFGVMLRAYRLRFSFARSRNCFIRVQDQSSGFLVEIVPPDLKYMQQSSGEYRVIPMGQADRLFGLSPAMRMIRRVKQPIRMLLDEGGNLVAT